MSIGDNDLIAIDTSALVHWVRQDSTGKQLLEEYALDARHERPLLSTIVEGEIRALARLWKWGERKIGQLDEILAELVRVDAGNPAIVEAYAQLHFEDQQGGHGTGQNDLWIAATAKATGAIVLTCDGDFVWMSPRLVRAEYVPQVK
jgi:tRNA(fMet)-specific endonuclease VapC